MKKSDSKKLSQSKNGVQMHYLQKGHDSAIKKRS